MNVLLKIHLTFAVIGILCVIGIRMCTKQFTGKPFEYVLTLGAVLGIAASVIMVFVDIWVLL